jgi:hypothetical protein
LITAWDGKRFYHFWRPITAIQNGNDDGNPLTAGDPTWLPQIPTFTPYPVPVGRKQSYRRHDPHAGALLRQQNDFLSD